MRSLSPSCQGVRLWQVGSNQYNSLLGVPNWQYLEPLPLSMAGSGAMAMLIPPSAAKAPRGSKVRCGGAQRSSQVWRPDDMIMQPMLTA